MSEQLPDGWVKKVSRSQQGRVYYYNTVTKTSQWTAPTEAAHSEGEVRVSHLLVKHKDSRRPSSWREDNITRTKEEAVSILKEYRDKISSGNATFQDLASKYSDCSSAKREGDLGFFGRGTMHPPFEDAAFALQVDELSPIVETASGVHIILRTG
mmetsp:Transcript_37474/g.94156  ORF Transcript_37474/g.94156 Transcript_37474/m.94156 type:complete len:155 (+) Transcript_37474:71-535(+)|eukprot:CAMPEP_0177629478 /NCGR_PEP_ID=MMETSP0447-20121125/689_1 /TAXON_ID=0 /ORGANISM="Stygamoeba regulata, Strain BSH-02190019" /LENGTH=154 /DNA_ID=CAMNT_0019130801 /DNA_START=48 /DNA_END=512 /DNA_ORIENTATION=+